MNKLQQKADEYIGYFEKEAKNFDLYEVIGWGQLAEKQEVFIAVKEGLENEN